MIAHNADRIAVWVNECCAFGKGKKRWQKICQENDHRLAGMVVSGRSGPESCERWVQSELKKGIRHFVAVGGDGTVNLVANALMRASQEPVFLGAIGIGSSNDFHKPFVNAGRVAGFPCRLNFARAIHSDLIRVRDLSSDFDRYALINASVGITAEANNYFNHPDRLLSGLKSWSSQIAIPYAALRTLSRYQNSEIEMAADEQEPQVRHISNIGIIKNPHFSGSFRYDSGAAPDSGDFYVYLADDMTRMECVKTLFSLLKGSFSGQPKTQSQRARNLKLRSALPFSVELDGEVIMAQELEVGIEERRIWLCQ